MPGLNFGLFALASRWLLLLNGRFSSFDGGIELLLLFLGFSYFVSGAISDLLIKTNSATMD